MSAQLFGGRDVVVAALAVSLGLAYAAAYSPLLAVLVMLGVVFISWVLTRAELVLLVVIAALPWDAMLQYPSETLSTVKLLGAALAVAYVMRAVRRSELVRVPPVLVLALLFGLVVGLSLLVSPDPTAGLTKSFRYAFFIFFLFLTIQLVSTREDAKRLIRVLVLSTAVAGLYGCASFLAGTVERASGPIADPNDFAYMMATVLPLALYLASEDRRLRVVWIASALILTATTFATLSRGAAVGLAALLLWAIVTRRVGITSLLAIAVATVTLVVAATFFWSSLIEERLEEKSHIGAANVETRAAFWSAAEQMAIDNPALGVGPGRFGTEAKDYVRNSPLALIDPVVHNSYLEILAEDGPFALLLFLGMLGAGWAGATRAENLARAGGDPETARLAGAVKAMLLVATVSGLFLSEQVAAPFWLACALASCGALYVPAAMRRQLGSPNPAGPIAARTA